MFGSPEPRRRKKDPDRERSAKSRDKDEKKERHKSSRPRSSRKTSSTGSAGGDKERERTREHSARDGVRVSSSSSTLQTQKLHSDRVAVVPEMDRRGSLCSPNSSRTSLSYPTLSRTHAKENIYSKEEAVERTKSPMTPEPTDLGADADASAGAKADAGSPGKSRQTSAPARAPPSPPLTATTGADLRKTASANSMRRKNVDAVHGELEKGRRSVDSGTRLTPPHRFTGSRSSLRDDPDVSATDLTSTTSNSPPSTVKGRDTGHKQARSKHRSTARAQPEAARRDLPQDSDTTQSAGSDQTSVPHDHASRRVVPGASPSISEVSPASVADSSPRTPTQHSVLPSVLSAQKQRPPTVEVFAEPPSRYQSVDPVSAHSPLAPPPPPPPPTIQAPPRVDYLLQNGGLQTPVVRNPLENVPGAISQARAFGAYGSPQPLEANNYMADQVFADLQNVFDNYNVVMDKNGSMAVATGYHSVSRRLLERVDHIFARDISGEFCGCISCLGRPSAFLPTGADRANWGQVLELISGRMDIPSWPPFDLATADALGISDLEAPCQRLDVDIPAQYRAHYERQSRKTKVAVESWLSNQQDDAPEEADDNTLTFAMLTRLEPEQRPLFYAILCGLEQLPPPRFQPPAVITGTPPVVAKAATALQRLYRLSTPPRAQLVVMYMIHHPDMHNMLATLASITKHEWDILISGRFDGFLWSGAEDVNRVLSPAPGNESRPGSARPGANPSPVQIDEDTEIAILADVERQIYATMDALENAFEKLHHNAENVRQRLYNRCAALQSAAHVRRGSNGIEVRMDTPASVAGSFMDQSNLDELRSEVGPDDSASNVSHNRRRRAHRTRARRTPAPVSEEFEE